VLAVALALAASLSWGTADFVAGVLGRRVPLGTVLAVSQLIALMVALAAVVAVGAELEGGEFALYALLSAVGQTAGMAFYYAGLSRGRMGVVAPISALAVLVPVAVGIATGERPTAWQVLGTSSAVAGVLLTAYLPRGDGKNKRVAVGVGLALMAALGFGAFYVFIDEATDRGDIAAAVLLNRAVAVPAILAAALGTVGARLFTIDRRQLGALTAVGLLTAAATLLFSAATTEGLVSLVAVVTALYPVWTTILARVVLGERLLATQRLGAGLAVLGVALIAAEPA
jgi:drug/metabolite transporter (DMT)-like permease